MAGADGTFVKFKVWQSSRLFKFVFSKDGVVRRMILDA